MLTPLVADRVAETTTTTGTGPLSLNGAITGFRTFVAGAGSGRSVEYTVVDRGTGAWEPGVGTVTAGTPDTLSRDRVKSSSNAGALVNFAAGTKDVFIAMPSQRGTTASQWFMATS